MILLDTNVLSELIRPAPEPAVTGWVGAQPSTSLFISAMTEAELLFGLAMLRDGKRRHQLAQAIDGLLMEDFAGRILPFDSPAASAYARIASVRRAAGGRSASLTLKSRPSPPHGMRSWRPAICTTSMVVACE